MAAGFETSATSAPSRGGPRGRASSPEHRVSGEVGGAGQHGACRVAGRVGFDGPERARQSARVRGVEEAWRFGSRWLLAVGRAGKGCRSEGRLAPDVAEGESAGERVVGMENELVDAADPGPTPDHGIRLRCVRGSAPQPSPPFRRWRMTTSSSTRSARGENVIGPRLLRELAAKHDWIGGIRGTGVFWAIELVADRQTREPLAPYGGTSPAMAAILAASTRRGLLPFANFEPHPRRPTPDDHTGRGARRPRHPGRGADRGGRDVSQSGAPAATVILDDRPPHLVPTADRACRYVRPIRATGSIDRHAATTIPTMAITALPRPLSRHPVLLPALRPAPPSRGVGPVPKFRAAAATSRASARAVCASRAIEAARRTPTSEPTTSLGRLGLWGMRVLPRHERDERADVWQGDLLGPQVHLSRARRTCRRAYGHAGCRRAIRRQTAANLTLRTTRPCQRSWISSTAPDRRCTSTGSSRFGSPPEGCFPDRRGH